MTATILDGKAVAAQIKNELRARVDVLRAAGVVPGLGTVLVGDDPGSHSYVAGKHRDCEQVGIESIRVDLPADASQAEVLEQVERPLIELTLTNCRGNQVRAAQLLGINRNTLKKKIDTYKIRVRTKRNTI